MRPSLVKRQTDPMSGFFLLFRRVGSWRCQQTVSCADAMSVRRRRPCAGGTTHVSRRSRCLGEACRDALGRVLRRSNVGALYRPRPRLAERIGVVQ